MPAARIARSLDGVAFGDSGRVVHLRGYGLILVFRIDTPDDTAEYGVTSELKMDAGARRRYAEMSFSIEHYHRELKRNRGGERLQARSERAQRNQIGVASRAFLRREWHSFTTVRQTARAPTKNEMP